MDNLSRRFVEAHDAAVPTSGVDNICVERAGPPSDVRRPSWGHHTWDSAKDRARLPWKQGVVQLAILGLNPTTESKAAEAFCAAGWPESRNSGCARSLAEGCAAGSDTETRRPIEAAASVCCGQRNHASER